MKGGLDILTMITKIFAIRFFHCTLIYYDIPSWNTFDAQPVANTSSTSLESLRCDKSAVACGNSTCHTCNDWTLNFIESGLQLHEAEQITYDYFPEICQCLNSECNDNAEFYDQFNWRCSDWQRFSCLESREYYGDSWTRRKQELLLENCCQTCLMYNVEFFNNITTDDLNNNPNFTCNLRTNPHYMNQCSHECEMMVDMGMEPTSCDVICTLSGHHCVAAYEEVGNTCEKAKNVGCYKVGQRYDEMMCECGHPLERIDHNNIETQPLEPIYVQGSST